MTPAAPSLAECATELAPLLFAEQRKSGASKELTSNISDEATAAPPTKLSFSY